MERNKEDQPNNLDTVCPAEWQSNQTNENLWKP